MLERWDRLSPNELCLTSHQKTFLCSSQDPLHSPPSVFGTSFLISLFYNPSGFSKVALVLPGRAAPLPPPEEWVRGLDAHLGLSGKHLAALLCLPAQSIGGTLARRGLFSPFFPGPPFFVPNS